MSTQNNNRYLLVKCLLTSDSTTSPSARGKKMERPTSAVKPLLKRKSMYNMSRLLVSTDSFLNPRPNMFLS